LGRTESEIAWAADHHEVGSSGAPSSTDARKDTYVIARSAHTAARNINGANQNGVFGRDKYLRTAVAIAGVTGATTSLYDFFGGRRRGSA
jgi:hypothetical protein